MYFIVLIGRLAVNSFMMCKHVTLVSEELILISMCLTKSIDKSAINKVTCLNVHTPDLKPTHAFAL